MKLIIGFSTSRSAWAIGSTAIRVAEKRDYSHSYVRFESPLTGVDTVVQASHGFINQQSFAIFNQKNVVVKEYTFDITFEDFKKLKKYMDENMGKPYSYLQIFFLAIKKLFRIEFDAQNKDHEFICSEFAARILEVLGIVNTSKQDLITPSDLEKMILRK
jgi:hypothetical protein